MYLNVIIGMPHVNDDYWNMISVDEWDVDLRGISIDVIF